MLKSLFAIAAWLPQWTIDCKFNGCVNKTTGRIVCQSVRCKKESHGFFYDGSFYKRLFHQYVILSRFYDKAPQGYLIYQYYLTKLVISAAEATE